jgi:hypothetical protein
MIRATLPQPHLLTKPSFFHRMSIARQAIDLN